MASRSAPPDLFARPVRAPCGVRVAGRACRRRSYRSGRARTGSGRCRRWTGWPARRSAGRSGHARRRTSPAAPGRPCPATTCASFHARLYESWIDVLEPRPFVGGCRCTASPTQNTRPLRDRRRVVVVDRPRRRRRHVHLEVLGADELHRELADEFVAERGRTVGDLVAPHQHPLVPRLDHAKYAEADAFPFGARLHHPVEDRRPVRDEARQVGLEDDATASRPTAPGPSNGRSRSSATLLRAPSAPTTYFDRMGTRRRSGGRGPWS